MQVFVVPDAREEVRVIFTPDYCYRFVDGSEAGVRALDSPLTADCEVVPPAVELIPGSEKSPWSVGGNVAVWTNGVGTLFIEGEGKMDNFANESAVPWAEAVDDVTAVTIADSVEQIGENALAGFADTVTVNGVALSAYRTVGKVETKINDMSLAVYNEKVRFLNVGEEWREARPASSETPVIPYDMVLVSKSEIKAAGPRR